MYWGVRVDCEVAADLDSLAKRLAAAPENEWHRITAFKEFTYEGLVGQADREIEWAESGLRFIYELSTRDPERWD